MAQDVRSTSGYYRLRQRIPFPFGWSPLETIVENEWSTYSDVWALGVNLNSYSYNPGNNGSFWEISACRSAWVYAEPPGVAPYATQCNTTITWDVVRDLLLAGTRLDTAEFPSIIKELLGRCFDLQPYNRPSVDHIVETMKEYAGFLQSNSVSFDLVSEVYEDGEVADILAQISEDERLGYGL